jgi:hypothetical protein
MCEWRPRPSTRPPITGWPQCALRGSGPSVSRAVLMPQRSPRRRFSSPAGPGCRPAAPGPGPRCGFVTASAGAGREGRAHIRPTGGASAHFLPTIGVTLEVTAGISRYRFSQLLGAFPRVTR